MTDEKTMRHFGGTARRVDFLNDLYAMWREFTPEQQKDSYYISRKCGLSPEKVRKDYLRQLFDMKDEDEQSIGEKTVTLSMGGKTFSKVVKRKKTDEEKTEKPND